jgi:hypothetical protein
MMFQESTDAVNPKPTLSTEATASAITYNETLKNGAIMKL